MTTLPGAWRVCQKPTPIDDGEPLPERYYDVGEVHRALWDVRSANPGKLYCIRYVPDKYDTQTMDLFVEETNA